jgi:2-keto-4-pentenoate hydratase/2-oxohepta-3-ene-1,7-dioic acid hydratase in catechol pathway
VRIATFDDDRVGIVTGHGAGTGVVDVTDVVHRVVGPPGTSAMRALITHWERVRPELDDARLGALPRRPLAEVRLGAPVPDPSKIAAAPVNYVDHMNEMSETHHVSSLGVFLKAPSSIIGPGGVVRLPYDDRRFDHEGELAFVIGRTARHVSPADAPAHVFGFTGLMDITMRGGEDRSTRKSFDTFTPMGPWIVTPDEAGPPEAVDLRLTVNGQERQHACVADLIWDVPMLLSYVSSVMTLHPGDVVTTGTPAGVGPVDDGDRVELVLSRIGALSVTVSAVGAVPCPTRGAGRGPVPPPAPAPAPPTPT